MLVKLISGGQTGVDRGALDAALDRGFSCGGACPRGRRAEDGVIPDRYPLTELGSANYITRTRRNVADADATLILARGALTGGTAATAAHARTLGRPCLVVDMEDGTPADIARRIADWLDETGVEVLNVAGPRESSHPGIGIAARRIVGTVLDRFSSPSPS